MPSPTLTRRALIAGAGTTLASAAIAAPHVSAAHSDGACSLPFPDETDGLVGLPLAAVHVERAIQAMALVTIGRWQVTITSGDADQNWWFKRILADRKDPLLDVIQAYRDGLDDFNALSGASDEERDAYASISYAPPMAVLDGWEKPATTLKGAVEALRLAVDENADFASSDMVCSMLYAALAYFDPATA